jgi:large subunit ribosomal protein L23
VEPTRVIRKPLITEKATWLAEGNRYSFVVERAATKPQIRRAVEALYGVRVLGVTTQNRAGKLRRYRHGLVQLAPTKRAVVKIHPEDKIELF